MKRIQHNLTIIVLWLAVLLAGVALDACRSAIDQEYLPLASGDTLPTSTATAEPTALPTATPTARTLPTITPAATAAPRRPMPSARSRFAGSQPSDQRDISPVTSVIDIAFVDAEYGWVLGRSIFCDHRRECPIALSTTRNGGETWHAIPAPDTLQAGSIVPGGVEHLRFANRSQGWLFGVSLFATLDGGKTWTQQRPDGEIIALEPTGDSVWAIERICSNIYLEKCHLTLLIAADDKQSWNAANVQPPLQDTWAQLVRADEQHAWIVQPDSLVATTDGGTSWYSLPTPCHTQNISLTELVAHTSSMLWLLCSGPGVEQTIPKLLYTSFDGGQTWQPVALAGMIGGEQNNLPLKGSPNDLAVLSSQHAFLAIVQHSLFGTSDGGQTWQQVIGETDDWLFSAAGGVWRVLFTDEMHGWAVGTTPEDTLIFRTTDGGELWEVVARTPLGTLTSHP